jgi:hypothetical protein
VTPEVKASSRAEAASEAVAGAYTNSVATRSSADPSPLSLEGAIDEAAISDEILRDTMVKELERDPEIDAKYTSVTALDDAITLGGHVMTNHGSTILELQR